MQSQGSPHDRVPALGFREEAAMTAAEFIRAALLISIALMVLALGSRCAPSDALYLFRRRALLIRSVLAMNVVLPIIAIAIAANTPLRPDVKIALIALSVSPVPPILPRKQLKLVASESYVYGLLVAASALSIVLVPMTVTLIGTVLGRDLSLPPLTVARTVLISVLAPLALGMLVRHVWPTFASRIAPIVSAVASVVLVVALAIVLIAGRRLLGSLIGDGTLLVFFGFALIGLAVGHVFGGPDPDDQTVLALACASRHPGVAVAIGAALFPNQRLVAAAVVLSLLVGSITSIPYMAWRKRMHDRAMHTHTPGVAPRH
jgi:bile acid:Na+ symporter, BASS family